MQVLLAGMKEAGTYKNELVITSPQKASVSIAPENRPMYNFCANNYLGFSNDAGLVAAAHKGLDSHGLGMSSVRFICGTQDIHKELEMIITRFYGTEDTILFPSAFDANGGIFEAILTEEDAVISDELNHASIIDGVRLCKAQRHRFKHMDLADLESILQRTQDRRMRLIATDGVFSMDGHIADLGAICDLADKYNALVFVDDAHATGFVGKTGRGTAEHCGVGTRVHLTSSTLGKAMGGASGGYVTGPASVIAVLRNKARPYLFSNSISPPLVAAAIAAFRAIETDTSRRDKLERNAALFRTLMTENGFSVPGEHPIVPVMLGDAKVASAFAKEMVKEGIYVVAFSYPVVPMGKARIRVQITAGHGETDIRACADAFLTVRKRLTGK
jgi:glycine C-acetyltransferase